MAVWTQTQTFANQSLFDSFDGNEFIRDNLIFLRDEAASAALISINRPTVTAANRDPAWKDIHSFEMTTYGKAIYSSLEFDVVNGQDTWGAGTVFVGADDVTDIVERVGERIVRVAVRDGYGRSPEWQALLRQRQQTAKLIDDLEDAIRTYQNVDAVFRRGAPPCEYPAIIDSEGHAFSSRDRGWLNWLCNRFGRASSSAWGADLRRQNSLKDDINRRMRAIGVVWRHKNIAVAGQNVSIAESSEITNTRVIRSQQTITYDRVFLRLLIGGTLAREFIHESGTRSESGAYYLQNIPAGTHQVKLQWRSPQFTGHTPLSGTLISLRNLNLQLKEVRYELLNEVI